MKVKKTILAALTLVCALLLFSSCGKENNDPLSNLCYYRAYGQLTATGGLGGSYSIGSFQSAINSAVGDALVQMDDAKVIAACDAVDAKIKADSGTKYSGYVEISRSAVSGDSNSTVIKKYTY